MKKIPESEAFDQLQNLYRNQYISHSELEEFKEKYSLETPEKSVLRRQKLRCLLRLDLKSARELQRNYDLLENRQKLNQAFIEREQTKPYSIEGHPLDPQQIAAVVATEDAELILAPAGSGKTASLLAKLDYLTNHLDIPPKDILVIAFTNKVVAELKDRIKKQGIEIRTFHSLGNKIVRQSFPDLKLITEPEILQFFRREIQQLPPESRQVLESIQPSCGPGDSPEDSSPEQLFASVLSLQKAERLALFDYEQRLAQIKNPASRQKSLEFYSLYAPIVEKYGQYLNKHHRYDFSDMLNLATDLVEEMPPNSLDYQYILVDEAQDLSTAKCLLLKAILKKCRNVKLFAVGDDWQSIYRFAGSNLKILDHFEQIFARETFRGLIELTYRFGQPTAKLSNKFIQKNPHQSHKKVRPHVNRQTPILIKLNPLDQPKNIPPDYAAVNQILQNLYQTHKAALFSLKIQIVSRYNRDIFRLVDESTGKYRNARLKNSSEAGAELAWRLQDAHQKLKLSFCSMHKAKGITRDIIIVINVNSGSHGIPATRASTPVIETLLTELDAYPHAEERRLFYVAITRAKLQTFLVSNPRQISPFVYEISPRLKGSGAKVCPKCHRGILLERRRKSDGKIYYACSNFHGGCRYAET